MIVFLFLIGPHHRFEYQRRHWVGPQLIFLVVAPIIGLVDHCRPLQVIPDLDTVLPVDILFALNFGTDNSFLGAEQILQS